MHDSKTNNVLAIIELNKNISSDIAVLLLLNMKINKLEIIAIDNTKKKSHMIKLLEENKINFTLISKDSKNNSEEIKKISNKIKTNTTIINTVEESYIVELLIENVNISNSSLKYKINLEIITCDLVIRENIKKMINEYYNICIQTTCENTKIKYISKDILNDSDLFLNIIEFVKNNVININFSKNIINSWKKYIDFENLDEDDDDDKKIYIVKLFEPLIVILGSNNLLLSSAIFKNNTLKSYNKIEVKKQIDNILDILVNKNAEIEPELDGDVLIIKKEVEEKIILEIIENAINDFDIYKIKLEQNKKIIKKNIITILKKQHFVCISNNKSYIIYQKTKNNMEYPIKKKLKTS